MTDDVRSFVATSLGSLFRTASKRFLFVLFVDSHSQSKSEGAGKGGSCRYLRCATRRGTLVRRRVWWRRRPPTRRMTHRPARLSLLASASTWICYRRSCWHRRPRHIHLSHRPRRQANFAVDVRSPATCTGTASENATADDRSNNVASDR